MRILLLEFTECNPVETWESPIISYTRSKRNSQPMRREGRKTDSTKEIPWIRENSGSPITVLQFTLSPFCTRGHPRMFRIDAAGCGRMRSRSLTHTHNSRAYNTFTFNVIIGSLAAAMCVSQWGPVHVII